jgi:3-hydroxymyristoyl/3-hydroxydecanoyl-(acyl carrier protein) dehydratase
MSFFFVDRITEIERGVRARGTFTVPASVRRFPSSLIVEAVGQLAAWVAMAAADFARRPVAALTHRIVLGDALPPGSVLSLAVEIERCEPDAVVYSGTAVVDGTTVTRLERSLGPMLPMVDFDDPPAMRAHFDRLCGSEPAARDFDGGRGWQLALGPADGAYGEHCRAALAVPEDAPFFADHFPRKPVLPATLLGDAEVRLAVALARQAVPACAAIPMRAVTVRAIKARAFVSPGDQLTLSAQVLAARHSVAEIAVSVRRGSRPIASARVELGVDPPLYLPP